jgi:thiamine biosynthesis lipoprotein
MNDIFSKKRIFTALIFFLIALIFLLWNKKNIYNQQFVQDKGKIFGTYYNITYKNEKSLKIEIDSVLNCVNNSLSIFNEASVISKINRNEHTKTDTFFEKVFFKAQEVSKNTNGAFDITIAPLVNLWGFGFKNCENVSDTTINSVLQYVGYQSVKLDKHKLIKQNRQTMLDASAIAKGFGCDLIAEFLKKRRIKNFCVEIGGEIVVSGKNSDGEKWRIGINKPIENSTQIVNEIEKIIHLTNAAMATSGNYRNFYEKDGKKISHTINPKTGFPVWHNLLSATIIAQDCAAADAYATACIVLGLEKSLELCHKINEIDGFFIYNDNGILKEKYSQGFEKYLK